MKYERTEFYIKVLEDTVIENFTNLIAYNICIGSKCKILKGTKIFRNVVINNEVTIGTNCIIGNSVLIRNNVKLGNDVSIGFSNSLEPFCEIGGNTRTQGFCMISEFSKIGKNCFLGPHFNSMGDDTIGKPIRAYKPNPPIIEDDCRFGSGTKVCPGIIIKKGTVTGAMSLLTKDTEENSLYYGVPARLIRKLSEDLYIS